MGKSTNFSGEKGGAEHETISKTPLDLAFGFGIATLLLALLVLFSGRRVQAGMNISPNNAAAQTAFQAQVAYDEAKTMEKLPPLSGNAVRSVAVFVAAAVVLAGFGVSLLF